jgi:cytochrome P450
MRPPAVFGQYKTVPAGGDTINGIFIPGGTGIGQNPVAMMRRQEIFGHDVEVFRPERFLECESSVRLEMERTIELIFGTGRFMCAGKLAAFTELNMIFFEVSKPTVSRE